MKNFSKFLLIAIIVTFISFILMGLIKDGEVTVESEIVIADTSLELVNDHLKNPENIKNWSLFMSDSNIMIETDKNYLDWKHKDDEEWVRMNISNQAGEIVYEIKPKIGESSFMKFNTEKTGEDINIHCNYQIEIPFLFRFFKESMKEQLQESLDKNLVSLKEYVSKNKE